jgi:formylglycine-generating enzyme
MIEICEHMAPRFRQRVGVQVPIIMMVLSSCCAAVACLLTSSLDSLGNGIAAGTDASGDGTVEPDVVSGDTPGDGCTAGPIATLDDACCNDSERACAGHAQKNVLICDPGNKVWTALQSCEGEQLCDTTAGARQASCLDPVPICIGKKPGDRVCDGLKAIDCGPDLVTSTETTCQYGCSDGGCMGVCAPGDKQCSGQVPQSCDANGQWQSEAPCGGVTPVCSAGRCTVPSCAGLEATCGPRGDGDCCASSVVTGGAFNRSNDEDYPATVSDFRMDIYEITVGRFRTFVSAYSQAMTPPGAGKNPNNATDPGGIEAWNGSLPADATALIAALKCGAGDSGVADYHTWTDSPVAGNETRPINCIDWFEAFAFCIWDGGRLPTEAEWDYAAAGGSDQRVYPWSMPATSTTIDCTYANYGRENWPLSACVAAGANNVGSESPLGDGKWGHADLGGNAWEWARDWLGPLPMPCTDCAHTSPVATYRVIRGGGFNSKSSHVLLSYRDSFTPLLRYYSIGARCVRSAQ